MVQRLINTCRYRTALTLFGVLTAFLSNAQYRVSGYISDHTTGEKLFGATILIEGTTQGVVSNFYGYYSLIVPSNATLVYSYVGYTPLKKELSLTGDITMDANLEPMMLEEVIVDGSKEESPELTPQVSTIKITSKQLMNLPAIGGEVDVLKALQLLPGVQSGKEGMSGIYVRGGGPDQNLILLDGVPLYNVSHLGGLFSVFNPDVISDVSLVKGGFPARYGGRLSSVVNIKVKDGNRSKNSTEATVGLISARALNQGPFKNGKGSYLLGVRRTYIDLLTRPLSRAASDGTSSFGYHFYDINAKVSYDFTNRDKVQVSVYSGDDRGVAKFKDDIYSYENGFPEVVGEEKSKSLFAWGNLLATARWTHLFSDKLFANLSTSFTSYRFKLTYDYEDTRDNGTEFYEYKSGIEDLSLRYELEYFHNNKHNLLGGIQFINHTFTPGVNTIITDLETDETEETFGSFGIDSYEFSGYLEDQWTLNSKIKLNMGVHYNYYSAEGSSFQSIQPRGTLRVLTGPASSIKLSYAAMQQNVHLLTGSGAGLPTDIWVPATELAKPQTSQQGTIAYTKSIDFLNADFTIEGYYKKMNNLVVYAEGENWTETAEDWQDKVETDGVGTSRGVEFLLHRKEGRLNGWLGYTISKSDRQFSNVNFGNTFPYKYDRRHDVGLLLSYEVSDKMDISLTWVYGTGNAITLGEARYNVMLPNVLLRPDDFIWSQFGGGGEAEHYNGRNGFRMRSYHRADLGIRFKKQKKRGERIWNLGIYNVYNRANPFYYYFSTTFDQRTLLESRQLKQVALFPIIPTISYTFKFN